MARLRAGLRRSIRYAVIGLTTLICLWAVVATARWITLLRDSLALPNGMILKREFDFTRYGRDDLFSTDGKTRLARDVDFICFNDRYVWVDSYDRGESGLYDAKADAKRNGLDHSLAFQISGLGGTAGPATGTTSGWLARDFFTTGIRRHSSRRAIGGTSRTLRSNESTGSNALAGRPSRAHG